MIVNVDFVYRADVLGRRQTTVREHQYLATEPVEIREVDPASAPVVIRTHTDSLNDGPRVREYRHFDDGLWLPRTHGHGKPPAICDAEWLRDQAVLANETPTGHGNAFAAQSPYHYPMRGRIEEDPGVQRVRMTEVDTRRAEVREAAAALVLVDGVVYRRAAEPVYTVSESGRYTFVYVKEYNPPTGKDAEKQNYGREVYRGDEAAYMAAAHPGSDMGEGRNVIEVLDAAALRAPLAEREMLAAARVVREELGTLCLSRDVAFFSVYATLRDAESAFRDGMRRAEADRTPIPASDALSDALRAGADLIAGIEREGRRDFRVEWADAALRRMEERQVLALSDTMAPKG